MVFVLIVKKLGLSGFTARLKKLHSVYQRKRMPSKGFDSLLILLGYVVIVVTTVGIVQDWMKESVVPRSMGDSPNSYQGFIPYLDPPEVMSADGELPNSVFEQVHRADSPVQLPSVASWEIETSKAQDTPETLSPELQEGASLERWFPEYLSIPVIGLDAPITSAEFEEVEVLGETYRQWLAPDSRRVGWQPGSATLGTPGNTVLMGHHNVYGEVFRDLDKLEIGDRITIYSAERIFNYQVRLKFILPEKFESVGTRIENARWIQHTQDERLTLVTCWPYETNTHRVILVAEPIGGGGIEGRWETQDMDP
jgi:LPXTG-site transpeptidase (sortase) family protein